jgi:DNA-directed RNA polymerase specialized sigma subunit
MEMKMVTKKKTTKKRGRRKKRNYFTEVHEAAIVQYASTDDRRIKEQLYRDFIHPAFDELVDKIVYTYKFTTLPNIDDLKAECKVWLTTILDKFDPDKGSKAFSYFSVTTKNWFIHKVKKNTAQLKREVLYDDMNKDTEQRYFSVENEYEKVKKHREFWEHLWKEMDNWEEEKLKPNEKKVLMATKTLFANSESLEIFNKKAIYFYLREITGMNTKQIVNSLNKLRGKYRTFKERWVEDEIK